MDVLCIRPILATIADSRRRPLHQRTAGHVRRVLASRRRSDLLRRRDSFSHHRLRLSAWPELVTLSVRRSADRYFIELPILWNVGLASFVLLGLDSFRYLLSV